MGRGGQGFRRYGRLIGPQSASSCPMLPFLDYPALAGLAAQAAKPGCLCGKTLPSPAWESLPVSFPEEQLRVVGTLRASDYDEPTFDEYHPKGTRFWSPDFPIAPSYFPYNRCDVWACTVCGQHYLRYTEGGGYFVDRRIRRLDAALLVDAPL